MAATLPVAVTHRFPRGISWTRGGPALLECRSHALVDDDGGVWLVDPIDGPGLDAELAPLGRVVGVIVLLDRHLRDAPAVARRHGARLLVPPGRWRRAVPDGAEPIREQVVGCPFHFAPVVERDRQWLEQLLWWPQQGVLVVAEAVATLDAYRASAEAIGVHPLLRVRPPVALRDARLRPTLLLVGHGDPVERDATPSLLRALTRARRDLPLLFVALPRLLLARRRADPRPRSGC
ncbi:MAG: hypothetical protein JWM90_84 [Thermoleophilia bacterium]|nr:hypothetical protein [Thermoleophilia bacterium]